MPTAAPLHPLVAARITGIDLRGPVGTADAAWQRDALYLSAHARSIDGIPDSEGRGLIASCDTFRQRRGTAADGPHHGGMSSRGGVMIGVQ